MLNAAYTESCERKRSCFKFKSLNRQWFIYILLQEVGNVGPRWASGLGPRLHELEKITSISGIPYKAEVRLSRISWCEQQISYQDCLRQIRKNVSFIPFLMSIYEMLLTFLLQSHAFVSFFVHHRFYNVTLVT